MAPTIQPRRPMTQPWRAPEVGVARCLQVTGRFRIFPSTNYGATLGSSFSLFPLPLISSLSAPSSIFFSSRQHRRHHWGVFMFLHRRTNRPHSNHHHHHNLLRVASAHADRHRLNYPQTHFPRPSGCSCYGMVSQTWPHRDIHFSCAHRLPRTSNQNNKTAQIITNAPWPLFLPQHACFSILPFSFPIRSLLSSCSYLISPIAASSQHSNDISLTTFSWQADLRLRHAGGPLRTPPGSTLSRPTAIP